MNSATVRQLLEINRRFYLEHGEDFADTRRRIQPGVRRVLQSLQADATILDLGCGSGALARSLSENGHRGRYLGLDFSPAALERARAGSYRFQSAFLATDLGAPDQLRDAIQTAYSMGSKDWAVVLAFAILHHIPGRGLRVNLLRQVRHLVRADGRFIHSNWQFSTNSRTQSRILPWSAAGMQDSDMDEGDFLIDWRRGGAGQRYVHEFRDSELADLAVDSGFEVAESFLADGADRRSGLYQIWIPA